MVAGEHSACGGRLWPWTARKPSPSTPAVLGKRTVPVPERERAAADFTALWPRFRAHVRAMPV
jgi:hypothetical protein